MFLSLTEPHGISKEVAPWLSLASVVVSLQFQNFSWVWSPELFARRDRHRRSSTGRRGVVVGISKTN